MGKEAARHAPRRLAVLRHQMRRDTGQDSIRPRGVLDLLYGVRWVGEPVSSVSLQCHKPPYQPREVAGRVPGYVPRVLRTPLRQPNHLPEIR